MSDYYYLVGSLPTLSFGEPNKINFDKVFSTLMENLTPSDRRIMQYMVFPNDNQNFIRVLSEKINISPPFPRVKQPSIFSIETLADYRKNADSFPAYLQKFIDEYDEQIPSLGMADIEKGLLNYFYEDVLQSNDRFLESYFQMDLNLRNIMAALNSRMYDFHFPNESLGESDIIMRLVKNPAADFGLSGEFPFIDSLSEAFAAKDPYRIGFVSDQIRWNYIEELTRFSFFDLHAVMGYLAKALIIKRWMDLDEEEGGKRLDAIAENIMKDFVLPEQQ